MRVAHILPQFSPGSFDGSERYEYNLAQALARQGLEVEILATATRGFIPRAPFYLQWPRQFQQPIEQAGPITIRRFGAIRMPGLLGYPMSMLMERRWRREQRRYGTMAKGSAALIPYFQRRARDRPAIYELMVTLARGPLVPRMLRYLKANIENYDLLQVALFPFAITWEIIAMARRWKKPVVLLPLFHPEDLSHHFRVQYWSLARADAVLAQTSFSARLMKQLVPECKPVEVGAGVDLEQFADERVSAARFRAKYGLGEGKLALLVGRKEATKRYDLAVQAVNQLDAREFTLVMIGRDIDRAPIASERVRYLGEVPEADLADAYEAAEVFVLPSEAESFGMVFVEAWARRKPVIGNSRCGPVAALIDHGQDGFLCADPGAIARALAQILADPALARRLGEAGYRKVLARYTWDAVAERVRNLYSQLLGQAPAIVGRFQAR